MGNELEYSNDDLITKLVDRWISSPPEKKMEAFFQLTQTYDYLNPELELALREEMDFYFLFNEAPSQSASHQQAITREGAHLTFIDPNSLERLTFSEDEDIPEQVPPVDPSQQQVILSIFKEYNSFSYHKPENMAAVRSVLTTNSLKQSVQNDASFLFLPPEGDTISLNISQFNMVENKLISLNLWTLFEEKLPSEIVGEIRLQWQDQVISFGKWVMENGRVNLVYKLGN